MWLNIVQSPAAPWDLDCWGAGLVSVAAFCLWVDRSDVKLLVGPDKEKNKFLTQEFINFMFVCFLPFSCENKTHLSHKLVKVRSVWQNSQRTLWKTPGILSPQLILTADWTPLLASPPIGFENDVRREGSQDWSFSASLFSSSSHRPEL